MNIESIIMGVGALALVIAPLLYYQRVQKKKHQKEKNQLDSLGQSHNLIFSRYEFWGSGYALGLDTSRKVLFYVNALQGQEKYKLLPLADVESCTVINDFREENGNRVIDQIRLAFTLKNARSHQSLLFYDKEENLYFTEELLLAEKWKDIVGSMK